MCQRAKINSGTCTKRSIIEFCVTNCVEYDDAINRAAIEDAELTKKIAAEPDNSIWPMRQQYYTIYLDALHAVGAQIGC
jgi:hypothetical protein